MLRFYKKIALFLIFALTLVLLSACSATGQDGDVSDSNSSSETGDGFIVADDTFHTHAATTVIGQADFSLSIEKETAADSVRKPYGNPTVVDGMLYLPDYGNYRAIGFNTIPVHNGVAADFAVGQRNLLDNASGSTEYQNSGIKTVTVDKGALFMTDRGNSRILIYKHRPLSEPAKADLVVGQIDFGRIAPALAQDRLNLPESLFVADDKLIVADSQNNRVLIWNTIPTENGAAADIVLGQKDFRTSTVIDPPTAKSLNFPTAVWSDGTQLVVLDAGNNRILVWNTFPVSDQEADVVLGQADFTHKLPNRGTIPTAKTLNLETQVGGLYSNGSQLFVSDSGNHRLLIWDHPLTTDAEASGLIGQDDFNSFGANRSIGITANNTLNHPNGVYQFYDKLIVADTDNNRYLIFESK